MLEYQVAAAERADCLVMSGLQILESAPAEARTAAIAALVASLSALPLATAVHWECASCVERGYVATLAQHLLPFCDSVGFNEQEAADLFEAMGGEYGDGASTAGGSGSGQSWPGPYRPASRAAIASMAAVPADVAKLAAALFEAPAGRRLSRMHFHALPFHVIGYREPAGGGTCYWRGGTAPVAAGSVAATEGACQLPVGRLTRAADAYREVVAASLSVLVASAVETGDPGPHSNASSSPKQCLSSTAPTLAWNWRSAAAADAPSITFALAAVCVSAAPACTVGLGDAISAAALAADTRPRRTAVKAA